MPWAAAVVAAVAAKKEADAAARQLEFERKVLDDLAKREKQKGRAEAADFRQQQSRKLARNRAIRAGSGVAIDTGSPLLSQADLAAEIEFGAQKILANSSLKVFNLKLQRNLADIAAQNKKAAAPLEGASAGGTTFLNSGGSFGGSSTGAAAGGAGAAGGSTGGSAAGASPSATASAPT